MRLAACAFLMRWWGLDGCITTDNLTITLTSSRFFRRPDVPSTSSRHPAASPSINPSSHFIIHHHQFITIRHTSFFKKSAERKKMVPRTYVCVRYKKSSESTLIDTSVPFLFLQSLLSLPFSLGRLFSVLLSFSNVLSICFRTIRTEETFLILSAPGHVHHLRSISFHNVNIFM